MKLGKIFRIVIYFNGHCGSDISNQHGVSVQLFLHLCQRQQASVQAAKVVSTINFNSAIYNNDTLHLMLYYNAQCLMHYHHYHRLIHLLYRCQHGVSKFKLPVSNRQYPNRSGWYNRFQNIQYLKDIQI